MGKKGHVDRDLYGFKRTQRERESNKREDYKTEFVSKTRVRATFAQKAKMNKKSPLSTTPIPEIQLLFSPPFCTNRSSRMRFNSSSSPLHNEFLPRCIYPLHSGRSLFLIHIRLDESIGRVNSASSECGVVVT